MFIERPYQEQARVSVVDHLNAKKNPLVVMATGTGKTHVLSHVADWFTAEDRGNVLFLAHRKELIRQAKRKLESICLCPVHEEMAERHTTPWQVLHARQRCVVVASKDTLKGRRLEKWPPQAFHLIITDEGHHAVASGYQAIYQRFPQALRFGVTATPDRADGQGLIAAFDSIAFSYPLPDAIHDGFLVPIEQKLVRVERLDYSVVRESASGDFNEEELARLMEQDWLVRQIVHSTFDVAGDRPTLIFCTSVKQAKHITDVANAARGGSCEYVASYRYDEENRKVPFDPDDRESIVKRFLSGNLPILANVGVFTEGTDLPNAAAVVMARPTKSRSLFSQMVGRGTRPLPGVVDGLPTADARRAAIAASGKPACLVLDFVGNAGKHELVHVADILLGESDDGGFREFVRRVKQVMQEKGGGDPQEVAREVREEFLRRYAELQAMRQAIQCKATFFLQDIPAFGCAKAPTVVTTTARRVPGDPPTESQVGYLKRLGVLEATARSYSKRQASAVIAKLLKERK